MQGVESGATAPALPAGGQPGCLDSFVARAVVGLPESITAAVTGLSIPLMVLLLLGHFTHAWTLSLGLVGAVIAVWVSGVRGGPVSRSSLSCTLGAVGLAIGWFAYNVQYSAQDVYAIRDPATYTITGRWLMDHASLVIHTQASVFGSPASASFPIGPYSPVSADTLNAQGNHLLPGMLAVSGSVFGQGALFRTNVAIGALALIVVFGLAKRIVNAPLALLAMAILAISMPYIYVSRDTFTEPLTMLFLIGSLALLHRAMTSWSIGDFALSGLAAGSAAMVRIDSYLALIGIVVAAAVFLAVAPAARRGEAAIRCAVLLAGAGLTALLGWVDLVTLSRQYYDSQHSNIKTAIIAVVLVVLVAPGAVWAVRRPALRTRLAGEQVRRRVAAGMAGILVAALLLLASRPFWMQTHGPRNLDLENMQAHAGVSIDGTRTYNERTVHWLALYLGWPTVVLAVAGYAVMITVLVRKRVYLLCATVAMGLSLSAFYLWTSKITPDQPWAMRRYVPVIMPLLLVAAMYGLRALWRWQWRAQVWTRGLAVAAAVSAVTLTGVATWPMRQVREDVPQLAQLQALCSAIGPDGAVVMLDNSVIAGYGQSVRSFCKVPAIGLVAATGTQIATMNRSVVAHGRTLFLLAQEQVKINVSTGWRLGRIAQFSYVRVQRWPNQVNVAPKHPGTEFTQLYLVAVVASGIEHVVPPVKSGS